MIDEQQKLLVWARITLDVCISVCSWLFAYYIRFKVIGGGQANLGIFFIKLSPIVALLTMYTAHKRGLYTSQRLKTFQREIISTIFTSAITLGSIVFISYFLMNVIISRMTLTIFFIIHMISLVTVRIIIRKVLYIYRKKGKNLRYVVAVGFGDRLEKYSANLKDQKEMGIVVREVLNPLDDGFDLLNELNKYKVDLIAISMPEGHEMLVSTILKICSNQLIPVVVLPNIPYSFIGSNIIDFNGIPILEFNNPGFGLRNRFIKRTVDIIGSLFGLVVFSPLYLIISILVKVTSRGPIFYAQERMTREGKVFKMWKFRSMKVGAENIGSGWTVKDDPRRTVIGPFLRATSLDEIPQLWNVFIGEMSLVGPRPERPIFIDKFKNDIPAYMLRHKMKAGITGWAQVNGWRGDTSIPKRIECDLYYIKNWSIILDFKILLLTFIKGFINKNAY